MLHAEPLGYNDLYLLLRIQALSLVSLKSVFVMYLAGRKTSARYVHIVLRTSQDEAARAIDHRETL